MSVHWRWGKCPRCGADAWLDARRGEGIPDAACSTGCDGTKPIFDYLEADCAWERRFAAVAGPRLYDDTGREQMSA